MAEPGGRGGADSRAIVACICPPSVAHGDPLDTPQILDTPDILPRSPLRFIPRELWRSVTNNTDVMTAPLPPSPHDRPAHLGAAGHLFDDLTLLMGQVCDAPVVLAVVRGEAAPSDVVAYGLQGEVPEVSMTLAQAVMALYPKRHVIAIADLYTTAGLGQQAQRVGQALRQGLVVSDTPMRSSRAAPPRSDAVSTPVRFFAGIRLLTPTGVDVGYVCAFDFQFKHLSDRQQRSLDVLGRQATSLLQALHSFGAKLGHDPSPSAGTASGSVGFDKILRSLPSYQGIVDILERVSDAFISVDDRWQLTYINAHAADLWTIDRDTTLGRDLWASFPELCNTHFERRVREAVEQRRARQFEYYDNDRRCWLDVHVYPAPGRISIYFHDITKLKTTEEASIERAHTSALVTAVSAALGQSQPLEQSLELCASALEHNLSATSVGIWLVEDATPIPAETESGCPLEPADAALAAQAQLTLAAQSGEPLPSELFPDRVNWGETTIGWVAQTPHPYCLTQFGAVQADATQAESPTSPTSPTSLGGIASGRVSPVSPPPNAHDPVSQWLDRSYLCTVLCYPLVAESRLIGVLVLTSDHSLPDNSHDILTWVANGMALAVDRIWARDTLSYRRRSLLFSLAGQIRNTLDLDTILSTAVREIRSLLRVDRCYYIWCAVEGNISVLAVTHEDIETGLDSWLGDLRPAEEARLARHISQLDSVRIDNVAEADPDTRQVLEAMGIISQLVLPLGTRAGQFGAIVCAHGSSARTWSNAEVELLHAAVDQLAIAIDQAELYAKTCAAALAAQTQAQQLQDALQNLKQTEAQLVQNEKMSSLGQMVAGIAHEINNPVNFISGNLTHASTYIDDLLSLVELYQTHFPNPGADIADKIDHIELDFIQEDLPRLLASMRMGADRIREIVLSLRNFSRLDEAEMKPVKLDEGIDSTLLILQSRLKGKNGRAIEVIKHYADLPLVDCYPGSLNQVFMNLIANAIDAEESVSQGDDYRPLIAITTEPVSSSATSRRPDRVRITIADNGSGIPDEIVSRLFDPFFTTKPVGKGTGLGLSISYQIVVDQHGGKLWCESQEGRGTSFFVEIPVHQQLSC